jgi:hypothetical protein
MDASVSISGAATLARAWKSLSVTIPDRLTD